MGAPGEIHLSHTVRASISHFVLQPFLKAEFLQARVSERGWRTSLCSAGESLAKNRLALPDELPLDLAAHADLVGRALELRDGDVVLLAGTIAQKGVPELAFPLLGVIILEGGPGGDDRYLRRVGLDGPLYRSVVDLTQVSTQLLAEEGNALWRLDKVGQNADGPVVTVTLEGAADTWWMVATTGGAHYVHVNKQLVDPATVEWARFVLRMGPPQQGQATFLIESESYPGEFLQDEGHIVNVSSVFGLIAVPGQGAYNAAKFAVRGYTECLRQELEVAGRRVSATCVHPGGIQTNIARNARNRMPLASGVDAAERFDQIARTTPEWAALRIVRGVQRNARRVLIGADAHAIDLLQRLTATGYQALAVAAARRGLAAP